LPEAQRDADLARGDYELALNDAVGLGSTPWSYYDTVYQLPLAKVQPGPQNTERFSSTADWALVQEAAATPLTDTTALDGIYANLEQDFLQQLPEIPLWYGGAWFQASTSHWDNYPSATAAHDNYTPVMWAGWLGCATTVLALAQLTPAHKSH
jgi:peptide/nickel transport system substrate-binding protein